MRSILFALFLVFFSGCAKYAETNVSVFHDLKPTLSGISYAIVPSNEQANSLEFQSYAKMVKAEFEKRGMIETSYNKAQYAVYLSYGIDRGKPVVSSYPTYGEVGIGTSFSTGTITAVGNTATYTGVTVNTPNYGIIGSESRTEMIFTSFLNMEIVDISKSLNGKKHKVYEGKANSSGQTGVLASIMPAIVRSVFQDFPGKSGSSTLRRESLGE